MAFFDINMSKYSNSLIFLIIFLFYFLLVNHVSGMDKKGPFVLGNPNNFTKKYLINENKSSLAKNNSIISHLGHTYGKIKELSKAMPKPVLSSGQILDRQVYASFKVAKAFNKGSSNETLNSKEENIKKDIYPKIGAKTEKSAGSEITEAMEYENLFRQGLIFIYRKDYVKAEKQFRELTQKNKNVPKYYYYLGYALYYQKRMAEALKEFQMSYSLDPAFNQALPKK